MTDLIPRLRVDGMTLPLGFVAIDKHGDKWIYLGLAKNTAGQNANFFPLKYLDRRAMIWRCAYMDSMREKFTNIPVSCF